jgi:superfamily II DNA or RNA helicase
MTSIIYSESSERVLDEEFLKNDTCLWIPRPISDLNTADLTNGLNSLDLERKTRALYEQTLKENPFLKKRPYQFEYAALYASRRKNICAGAPGIGKTLIAGLTIASVYPDIKKSRPGRVHVIVPSVASARVRWAVDLERIPALAGLIQVIDSEKAVIESTAPVWVYHMDLMKRQSKLLKTTRRSFSRLAFKLHRLPSFLIVDEIHNFKKGSKRTQHLNFIRRHAKRVLALSGTLSDGDLQDVSDLCQLVYGNIWNYSSKDFVREFGTKTQVQTNYMLGEVDLDDDVPKRYLAHLSVGRLRPYYDAVSPFIHRATLDDPNIRWCVDLPKLLPIEVHAVQMDPEHAEVYRRALHQHFDEMERLLQYPDGQGVRAKAFSLIHRLMKVSNAKDSAKARECLNIVREVIRRGEKAVVFTEFIDPGRHLKELFKRELGQAVVRIYAEDDLEEPRRLSGEERVDRIDRFMYDPSCTAGIFSRRLTGESIDLTSASTSVFHDLPWEAKRFNQAVSRVYRPGSVANEVHTHVTCHAGTVDVHVWSLLLEKIRSSRLLLDYDVEQGLEVGQIDPLQVLARIVHQER